jgi:predicted nucleotidyltransferase
MWRRFEPRFRSPTNGSRALSGEWHTGQVSVGENIREHRDEILRIAAHHGAGNVRLFGSVARGDDTSESDVDLLIDVTGDTSPWFPGSLVADLEQLLGRRVQVVIRRSLSHLIRDAVLREAVPL